MSILLVPDNSSLRLDNDGEEAELELQGYGVLADVGKTHEPLPAVLKLAETPVTPTPGADADLTEQSEDKLELQHHDHSLSLIDEDAEEQRDDIDMEAVVPGSPAPELESEAQPTSTDLELPAVSYADVDRLGRRMTFLHHTPPVCPCTSRAVPPHILLPRQPSGEQRQLRPRLRWPVDGAGSSVALSESSDGAPDSPRHGRTQRHGAS